MSEAMTPEPQPPVGGAKDDRRLLERAAMEAMLQAPREASALLQEVDRASVVEDADLGRDVVRLGSWVQYADSLTGSVHAVRLVARRSADNADEVTPLSSLGAALLGLRAGQHIVWPDRLGSERALTVVKVGTTGE